MTVVLVTTLLMLIFAPSKIEGLHECCPGKNLISMITRKCSTNDSIFLECDGARVPITNVSQFNELNYSFTGNGTLINRRDNSTIKYCQSLPDDDTIHMSDHIYVMCYVQDEEVEFDDNRARLGAVLGYISVGFIILTIIVYAMVPKLLDLQGICMMHALVGLAAGYTFLDAIQLTEYLDEVSCIVLPFLTYFSFLYVFFWLNTLSFHIWRITVKPQLSNCTLKWTPIYHIFAIGGTLAFVIFLSLAHYSPSEMWDDIRPGIAERSCWFRSMKETMIFFYGPIAILLLLNAFFYVWTVYVLWKQIENNQNKILKYRLKICVRLFIIMGMTWFFEIITAVTKDHHMNIFGKIMFFLLDLFNILQGFLIFLVLVVFRKRVRRALASKNLCNIQFPNSWKYLEDEEMESAELRGNATVAEYKEDKVEIKR